MADTDAQDSLKQRLAQEFLGPIEEAVELARRYRDIDEFHDYVNARLRLVIPASLLILVTGIACGLTPMMLLIGTRAVTTLLGLLLTPVVLLGSLLVLSLVFFSWLEERSLARSLGHRGKPARGTLAHWLKRKLGADLGKAPRIPWLLAMLFVVAPFALLAATAPAIAVTLLALIIIAPVLFARLDR